MSNIIINLRVWIFRIRRERDRQFSTNWQVQPPEEMKLRDEDITEFVEIILESALLAMNGRADVTFTLHSLAIIKPALVVPPLLERLHSSLESLTEPHKLTAAMQAVSAVARPMVCGANSGYPEGQTFVVPLLLACLPGLDPNDVKKTMCTLHLISVFSWMVPYIDCSTASDHYTDLTEEELLTCESTAQFEDFVLLYFERIFNIIESFTQEQSRHEVTDNDSMRSKLECILETALFTTTTALMMQCSPKIFSEALRKFKQFSLNSNFDPNLAGGVVAVILRVFAHVDPEAALSAFVPQLCKELVELLASDEVLVDEHPPRELLYRLQLLNRVVETNGTVLTKYVPQIIPVLDRGLKQHSKDAINRACGVLAHIMVSLGTVDLMECKSVKKDYGAAPKDWLPIRTWGKGCKLKQAKFDWYIPGEQEIACAQMLFDRYVKPELTRLDLWLKNERAMCPKRRMRSFMILLGATRCCALLPQPEEDAVCLYVFKFCF